ncbi:MAG: TIGR00269 family protein [Desulfurococcales archaeon]|nr:TIGR00269 family protein [Desulfurococcales archaeon]
MPRCSICSKPAIAYIRYQRKYLCRDHYIEFIEDKVRRALRKYKMVGKGYRILVALSGGKDSSTLLGALAALRSEFGYELVAVHIDLGIYEYSVKSKMAAEELAKKLEVPLIEVPLSEVLGTTIPELANKGRRPPCSVCGMVKRYITNAAAVEVEADAVALGHNADDLAVYNLKSFLSQDLEAISKLGPKTESVEEAAIGRIRPLYLVYEKESFLYAYLKGLPFLHEECPFVDHRQMEVKLKEVVNSLEEERPGMKIQMMSKLALRIKDYPKPQGKIGRCKYCGLITGGDVCSFCRLTKKALGEPMGPKVREYIRSKALKLGLIPRRL